MSRTVHGAARSLARELPGLSPALLVVALLLCLLLPLPTAVIDLLLSLSLAGAVLLLVASLRVPRVSEFLAFPRLVLLLTLVRLALNVSTTRLILSQADAGRVIDAFAGLIVRGDLLIGAVMFAIITAIQYLVVARGAERVAEVAARFELDGMPGQQAAIEADLRAGAISPAEAEARRAAAGERSELFARMDGVMRIVKGDAVVGLAITAINLVGGVAVGGLRARLGIAESLAVYGKLAIGDGLLAQIPALLVALAAAILVARVDHGSSRARASWLQPAMLLAPALLLGALAPVPGMPTLAFATCATGLVAVALWLSAQTLDEPAGAGRELEILVAAQVDPGAGFGRELQEIRRRCQTALVMPVPRLVFAGRAAALGLEPDEFELRLGERVLARRRLGVDGATPDSADALLVGCYQVVMDSAERLVSLEQLERELEGARRRHPSLVREALRVVQTRDLLAIVRALVRERIPAPRIDTLIAALAEDPVFQREGEREAWPEHVREALADTWLRELCDGLACHGHVRWVRPSVDFEDLLIGRVSRASRGPSLSVGQTERERLLARLRRPGAVTAIVTSAAARPAFAALVRGCRPPVHVLSVGEFQAAILELPRCTLVDLD